MAYYYIRDNSNFLTNWSVDAPFAGCVKLPDSVVVPEPLQTCACNLRAYKYENGVITYHPDRETVGDLYPPAVGSVEYYTGSYVVIPDVSAQRLATAEKYMQADVTVKEIPYFDVGNTAGGSTVYIGTAAEMEITQ